MHMGIGVATKQNRREENNYEDDDVDQKFVIYRKKIMYRRSRKTILIFFENFLKHFGFLFLN